jgi:release factor glutamine methyltransferase
MTVLEAYQHSARTLQHELVGLSRTEACSLARLLVDYLTGQRYAHLLQPAGVLQGEEKLYSMLAELAGGRPLPYVLKCREFYGLTFRCDDRALIPRPETELLVETTVARLRECDAVVIADLGTGSGCIAVSVTHALPLSIIYATDASEDALALAHENAVEHEVANRVHFLTGAAGDWNGPLLRAGLEGKLDAIVTNPPYIAAGEIATLQTQVRDWEPRTALDGGADGLDEYRRLASQCGTLLKPGGFLAAELGAGQFEAVRAIFIAAGWSVEAPLLDFAGIERVLVAQQRE